MRQKIFNKIITGFLVGALIVTFGFLTGFVFPDNSFNSDITVYIKTGSVNYNESGDDDQGEDIEATEDTNENTEEGQGLEENEQEVETWVCDVCGYIYDPAIGDLEHGILAGTAFEALPDTWLCPVCSAPKTEFENEDSQDLKTPQEWLAHLEHVLAMRSKHLVVLQRVIDAKIAKNFLLHSISSLEQALLSSSKSVQKAQAAVDGYKAYMESLNNPAATTTDTTSQTITNGDTQNTITDGNNENDKNNKNNEEKENKNKGKAKGKNK